MLSKKDQRVRRSKQTRTRIALQRVARLTVHRTNLHIYAAVISDDGTRVLASASTAEADVRKDLAGDSKVAGQGRQRRRRAVIGKRIAEKAKAAGIERVAFDPRRFRVPRPRQGAGRRRARSRPPVLIARAPQRNSRWQSFIPARRPKATTTV
jgi:large subunit ribosomal protein L18